MKAIVIYGSKHGATKEVATRIGQECSIQEVEAIENFQQNIETYDTIIIGTSLTAGMVDKKIKEFCSQEELLKKKIILFISSITTGGIDTVLEQNFTENFINTIQDTYMVGGKLNFPDMNVFERTIIKMINKKEKFIKFLDVKKVYDLLNTKAIEELISAINNSEKS